jgi:hypothetical protein
MKRNLFIVINLFVGMLLAVQLPTTVNAQEKSETPAQGVQTIKGRIIDGQTKAPLFGAYVQLLTMRNDTLVPNGQGTVSDEDGYYKLSGVPVGRVSLRYGMIGYQSRSVVNTLLITGKELVLNTSLEESVTSQSEVVIRARTGAENQLADNEFAFLSARGFDADETRRYAGSRQDPARMASNFAGVSGQNDGRNDIVIRGNSPAGLLWRLEGADIFNPSHFGALGTTGGPVSMINNNVLDKSDFITGAFPAEYGNALSGVFDLQMRAGNNEKHEFLGQVGFNGFEFGAEGPLKKGSRASYLVNARYSTLAAVSALGVQFGTGSAVPYYQDMTFKIHVPTDKLGTFSFYGLGGFSSIRFKGREQDTSNLFFDSYRNVTGRPGGGTLGLKHVFQFSPSTYGEALLYTSYAWDRTEIDTLLENNLEKRIFRDRTKYSRTSFRYSVGHRVSSRLSFKVGLYTDNFRLRLVDSLRLSDDRFIAIRNAKGNEILYQGFAQALYRFSDRSSITAGINSQLYTINEQATAEPRLAYRYGIGKTELSLATGLHAQLAPLATYYVETEESIGIARTNKKVKPTKAIHLVAGISRPLGVNTRVKLEAYHQTLYDVAVETRPSTYSILNEGADFNSVNTDSLRNTGRGRNYGLELTLERTFDRGYYFLVTGSLYDSKYQGSDGIWRNTAFNSNYITNVLAGKEWKAGRRSVIATDIKLTVAGGKRYSPIDTVASRAAGQVRFVENERFTKQFTEYFRLDIKFTYRINLKKASHEFFVDVQNITNRENPYIQTWDVNRERLITTNQLGLFPNVNYRVNF